MGGGRGIVVCRGGSYVSQFVPTSERTSGGERKPRRETNSGLNNVRRGEG